MNTVRSDVCPGCGHSYPCLNDWVAGRCVDCLRMGHVCEYLGHAIARFVRRATVADLVEQIRQIHDGDCSWWEDAACDCSIRGHLTALSRLARLAGGGA